MREVAWFVCVLGIATVASAQSTRPSSGEPRSGSIFDFGRDGPGEKGGAGSGMGTARPADTQPAAPAAAEEAHRPFILTVTATIDGSDELVLSANGAVWTHKYWDWPTDVTLNEVSWDPQAQPKLTSDDLKFLKRVDFSKAKVLARRGRDTVALEQAGDHVTIFFADSPNDGGEYQIKIELPAK